MKILQLCIITLLCSGCLDLVPKDKLVDVEARLEAKMDNRLNLETKLNNQIGAQGNVLETKLSALETKLTSQIQQTIGQVTGGQVNTGPFSGGALYVTIVCALIVICITSLAGYLFWASRRWKTAFQTAKEVMTHDDPGVKALFHTKMDDRGLSELK